MKFLADVEPCLAENQKSSKYTIQNITEAILKFACEDEGDHIARKLRFFIAIFWEGKTRAEKRTGNRPLEPILERIFFTIF